jgi:hypothetical protein
LDQDAWPKSSNGKCICCPNTLKLSILQENKWEVGQILETTLLTPSNIPHLRYGWIYRLLLGPLENCKQYEVMIRDYSACSCMNFFSMMFASLNKWGLWAPCKHLYYIFNMPCILGLENHSSTIHLGIGMKFINY